MIYDTGLPGESVINNLPGKPGAVRSLGWEDLLEQEMVTHSSILAWEIPGTGEPGRQQSVVSQELDTA